MTMPSSWRFPPPRSPTTSAAVLSRRLGTTEAVMAYSVDRVGLYANRGRDMYLLASPRHSCALLIVLILTAILAFSAIAQTSSDSDRTGTASARAHSEVTGGATNTYPTPKTGPNTAAESAETNSTAVKGGSEPGGAQPESNPGTKKGGAAVVINIDKTKQEMTVLVDGIDGKLTGNLEANAAISTSHNDDGCARHSRQNSRRCRRGPRRREAQLTLSTSDVAVC